MGFFSNLFGKKEEEKKEIKLKVYAPINGKIYPLSEVPDETFATKILGDGIAIEPNESGKILSPIDGVITQLFETGHAFTVESKDGISILVHFGLNTVELKGQGFNKVANEGDTVKVGDPIVEFDLPFLKENSPSVLTPVIVLDSDDYKSIVCQENKTVRSGLDEVLEVEK